MILDFSDDTYHHHLVLFYPISVTSPTSPAPGSRNLPDNFCISAIIGRLSERIPLEYLSTMDKRMGYIFNRIIYKCILYDYKTSLKLTNYIYISSI